VLPTKHKNWCTGAPLQNVNSKEDGWMDGKMYQHPIQGLMEHVLDGVCIGIVSSTQKKQLSSPPKSRSLSTLQKKDAEIYFYIWGL